MLFKGLDRYYIISFRSPTAYLRDVFLDLILQMKDAEDPKKGK